MYRLPLIVLVSSLAIGCAQTQESESSTAPIVAAPETVTTSDYTRKSGGDMPVLQQGLTVKHADLSFTIYPKTQFIAGSSMLTINASEPIPQLVLDLDRVFDIELVQINGETIAPASYRNLDGMLVIDLPSAMTGKLTARIDYRGKPVIAVRAPWDGGFVWKKTPSGEDWIATAVQGEGCDLFWPCVDYPTVETEKIDMHITVPSNLVAAANGVFKGVTETEAGKTYHWQTQSPQNGYGVALNIGPYELLESKYESIFGNEMDVQFYFLRGNEEKAQGLFDEIPAMIEFFETMIGPYPFANEKVGIVETPHLGMEHQTINAYGNKYKKDEYGYDWLLQHEFAHEWFGNQLTNTDWDHMWLHEGYGAYMQPLYAQYLHGNAAYFSYMYKQRKTIQSTSPLVSNTSKAVEDVYKPDTGPGGDIYVKGSWVLHTLRYLIGDEAFFAATTELVYGRVDPQPGNFQSRLSDTSELITLVNKHAKSDLTWFFDVYVHSAALPILNQTRDSEGVSFAWKTEGDIPFPMPVEVSVNGKLMTLDMGATSHVNAKRGDIVIVDPNSKLLKFEQHIKDLQSYYIEQSALKAKAKADNK